METHINMQLDKVKYRAPDLARIIPDSVLAQLATQTNVDYYCKVLSGERMFHLLLYAFVMSDRTSQRKIEAIFSSEQFVRLFGYADLKVSHSSISTRLSKMNVEFFEKAYEYLYDKMSALYTEKELLGKQLIRVDSSMVAETCNKLQKGFTVGAKPKHGEPRKLVKYTMGYDGFAVRLADIFSEPTYLSEDVAMPSLVSRMVKADKNHANVYVLDRGLQATYNFEDMSASGACFIGRLRTNSKKETVRSLLQDGSDKDLGKLELLEDEEVRLFDNASNSYTERTYRAIRAKFKIPRDTTRPNNKGKVPRTENEVVFITNNFELSAKEVAEAYRRRWDIEVFFRFLKQELNFSHFLSVNENGMRIVLYMTLISSVMIMIYKKLNEVGYSDAKFAFRLEMSDYITALSIHLSGGDVTTFTHRYTIRDKADICTEKSFDHS